MPIAFEDRILEERKRMRVTPEQLRKRVADSPYGPKARAMLEDIIETESTSSVGFGIWSCPPFMERGKGALVYDVDGKEYIDMISGFSVNNLGHCHPEIVAVLREQAATLIHYFDLPNPERAALSRTIIDKVPGDFRKKVTYNATGSECIETAVRLARWYTGKQFILTPYGDYHGRTALTAALTGKGGLYAYNYPVPPADSAIGRFPFAYCYRCPVNREYPGCNIECAKYLEDLLESKEAPYRSPINNISNTAAILIEPMQSSAAYLIPPPEYMARIREICDHYEILLIADEIQAGMGRTGKMWACDHSGIAPDLICVSKSLGAGMPIAAVVGRAEIMDSWGPGANLGTFAATPMACAAANKVFEIMERDDIPGQAAEKGKYFLEGLAGLAEKHRLIGDYSGCGLYLALEFVKDRASKKPAIEETAFMAMEVLREGLILEPGGYYYNRFQFIPTLVIEKDQIDRAVAIMDTVLTRAEKKFGYA